jgi:hypothetical protein
LFNELVNIGPENGDFGHESHPFRHTNHVTHTSVGNVGRYGGHEVRHR